MNKAILYSLIAVLSFWSTPGLCTAFCLEIVEKIHAHDHGHVDETAHRAHGHEPSSASDEGCCDRLSLDSADAFTLNQKSVSTLVQVQVQIQSALPAFEYAVRDLVAWRGLPGVYVAHSPPARGPLYALFASYLI